MDAVASLYGRNHLAELVTVVAKDVFVPLTVGGGIRTVDDIDKLLRAGADKVAINTAAVSNPDFLKLASRRFGSQSVVLSIEAKEVSSHQWEVYTDNGRERSRLDVLEWAKTAVDLGVGEILLTSVDREGTLKGFDVELVRAVVGCVDVPVIASGGMGSIDDLIDVVKVGQADAVAMAHVLHYRKSNVGNIREAAKAANLGVRDYGYT